MRTRLLIIALPAFLASGWLGISGALSAGRDAHAAEVSRSRASVVGALVELSVAVREVQIEVAGHPVDQRIDVGASTSIGELADVTNALQRVVSRAQPAVRGQEMLALEALGERVGGWGEQLDGQASGTRAPDAASTTVALTAELDSISAQVSDVLTSLAVRTEQISGPDAAGVAGLLATVERLDRIARSDVGVLTSAMKVLATPPDQRVGIAREVGIARRVAAQSIAGAVPALDESTREQVQALVDRGDEAFLASFADDEIVRTMSASPASMLDSVTTRDDAWSSIQRDTLDRLSKRTERLVESSTERARDWWALAALVVVAGAGASLIAVSRAERLIARRLDEHQRADVPVDKPVISTEQEQPPVSPEPPSSDDARDSAVLACLVDLARAQRAAQNDQLDVFDQLGLGRDEFSSSAQAELLERSILRARRLSEAALVVAGAESERPVLESVPLTDVIDAAAAEVAGSASIVVSGADGLVVRGDAVVDIAHLLAELCDLSAVGGIEPNVAVKILRADADRMIVVLEHALGIGASVDVVSLEAAVQGEFVRGGLGWMAAGELARRRGIELALDESSGAEQLRMAIVVPADLITDPTAQHDAGHVPMNKEQYMIWGWTSAGEYLPATGWRPDGDFVAPSQLSEAVPTGEAFESGLSALIESGVRAEARSGGASA